MPPLLTKSKFLCGMQCPVLLWVSINDKDRLPEAGLSTQHKFDQGQLVGEISKQWFPTGIDIPYGSFEDSVKQTKELLTKGVPLFEASIMVDGLYSRADILVPIGEQWDVYEVKSATAVKEVNVWDVSFQKYVYEKAGLKIRNCYLMFINNEYVRRGKIDARQFLKTEEMEVLDLEDKINEMKEILRSSSCPDQRISKKCKSPYTCPIIDECWRFLPEHNVFTLSRGGKKSWNLFDEGILDIKDIPEDYKLTPKQKIQRKGEVVVSKSEIKQFLDTLTYPLYFLDFETFSTAVPLFEGTKPYQRMPFQFSLHIVQQDGNLTHLDFLADENGDPRLSFLKSLKKGLEGMGSIVVYNQSFEKSVLKELARDFPEYSDWVDIVLENVVDLLDPFKNFHYYNPVQQGSASIKRVLPALTGKSYSDLEINNGEDASLGYLYSHYGDIKGNLPTNEEKEKIRQDLLEYCRLDTEGMVWIVERLRALSEGD